MQHPLFVANDDFRSIQIDQLAKSIVSVDDPTIQVVQVGGCKVSAIEQNQWTQVGRNDRNNVKDHPFWTVFTIANRFDQLESVNQFLLALLAARLMQLGSEFF